MTKLRIVALVALACLGAAAALILPGLARADYTPDQLPNMGYSVTITYLGDNCHDWKAKGYGYSADLGSDCDPGFQHNLDVFIQESYPPLQTTTTSTTATDATTTTAPTTTETTPTTANTITVNVNKKPPANRRLAVRLSHATGITIKLTHSTRYLDRGTRVTAKRFAKRLNHLHKLTITGTRHGKTFAATRVTGR